MSPDKRTIYDIDHEPLRNEIRRFLTEHPVLRTADPEAHVADIAPGSPGAPQAALRKLPGRIQGQSCKQAHMWKEPIARLCPDSRVQPNLRWLIRNNARTDQSFTVA